MKRRLIFKVAAATAALASLGAAVYAADMFDKYSLKSPSGIAFSEFKGYEDWAAGTMVADPATADCGHVCHLAVKSKDYIFHPYQIR